MTCTDCGLTDMILSTMAANDDRCRIPRCVMCELMGAETWRRYCERWNPMRWWPKGRVARRRRQA